MFSFVWGICNITESVVSWRVHCLAYGSMLIWLLYGLRRIYESPKYLLETHRYVASKESLRKIAEVNDIKLGIEEFEEESRLK